ncbi:MAG: hypothetical protein KDK70_35790, partial [Myxococcales bacterium]|nr:hypothetical protein [Myxococcales bacterium]
MLNADLCLSQWSTHFTAGMEGGVYGPDPNNPLRPEDPSSCTVRPRLLTLTPGQHIYRWVDAASSGSTYEEKATGRWWSTKRGAMHILLERLDTGATSTTDAARRYSSVKHSWSRLD